MFAGAVVVCVASATDAARALAVPALSLTTPSGTARRPLHAAVPSPTPTTDQQRSLADGATTPAALGALHHEDVHFRIPGLSYRLLDGSTATLRRLSYWSEAHAASHRCVARARGSRRRIHGGVRSLYKYLETIHSVTDLDRQRSYARQLQRRYDRLATFLHRRMARLGSCGLSFREQDLRKIYYLPVGFSRAVPGALPFFPDTTVLRQRAFDSDYPHSLRNLLRENSFGRTDVYGHVGDTVTVAPATAYCSDPADVTCWIACPETERGNSFACRQEAGLSRVTRAAVAELTWDEHDPPDVIVVTLEIAPGMQGVPGVHLGPIRFADRSGRSFFADLIVHYPYPSLGEDTSSRLFHEFGHALGAEHSGALQCDRTAGDAPYPLPRIRVFADGAVGSFFQDLQDMGCSRNSYTYTYGDPYCAMGSRKLGHLSAINKERAGWLGAEEIWVAAPDVGQTIPIGNLEEPSESIKHVKIPIEDGYYYSLEYRTLYGLDGEQNCGTQVCPPIDNALLVRVGLNPEIVGAVRISSFLPIQGGNYGIVVREGEAFTDPVRNLRIELVNGDGSGGTVKVTRVGTTSYRAD
jgi:hypothetical protein